MEFLNRTSFGSAPKTAFVLSGGGNLGALQVGMLRALSEAEIVPDVVLGCSVGALNGAAYCAAPTRAGMLRMEEIWQGISSPSLMPSSWIPSAVQLLRKRQSLHSNEGLIETIVKALGRAQRFEDLSIPFECVATDVDSVLETWFSEGELARPILASAALPAVFPPVEIEGRNYIDGGVVDNVPISRAIELGCNRLFVLNVGKQDRPDADLQRPLDGALLAYWVAKNHRFARDLAEIPRGVEVILLPTGLRPGLKYDDFGQSAALISQGHEATTEFLAQRAADLAQEREDRSWRGRFTRLRARGAASLSEAQVAADDPAGAFITHEDDPELPEESEEGAPNIIKRIRRQTPDGPQEVRDDSDATN